jgi:hypothetical protein
VRLDGLALDGGGGGSPSAVTFLWELVCDINFALEADQALSGGNLTVTNRVTGDPVVLAGQTVEIVSGALVMTAAASSNLGLATASTRSAALLGATMATLWPDFDGHPVRWGAEVTAAPTFDAANRAWGVFAENAVGLGGGNLGAGFSAEVRGTGAGTATRQSRTQANGSTSVASLSSTAYAAGLVCGIGLDGRGAVGLWSTTADDLDELDTLSAVGGVGAAGASSGGSPVQGVSRLGVFAVASAAGSFVTSIKRLVLWVRVARVA